MSDDAEKTERQERAKRLRAARKRATTEGPTAICDRYGWSLNNYKAHESGRNGFGIVDGKRYAKAFGVSVQWLNFNIGTIEDKFVDADEDIQEVMELLETLPPAVRQTQIDGLRNLSIALRERQKQQDAEAAKNAAE